MRDHDGTARDLSDALAPAPPRRRVVRRVSSPSLPLDAETLARVRELIGQHGLQAASRELQMPPSTIASAAAGATLRHGTSLLLTQRLAALKAAR